MAGVNLSRKIYALRNKALRAGCEPKAVMVDVENYQELRRLREYEPYPEPSFMGMSIELSVTPVSMLYSSEFSDTPPENELSSLETLLCVRAICDKTGRTVYFDDESTTAGFLPRATAPASAT